MRIQKLSVSKFGMHILCYYNFVCSLRFSVRFGVPIDIKAWYQNSLSSLFLDISFWVSFRANSRWLSPSLRMEHRAAHENIQTVGRKKGVFLSAQSECDKKRQKQHREEWYSTFFPNVFLIVMGYSYSSVTYYLCAILETINWSRVKFYKLFDLKRD